VTREQLRKHVERVLPPESRPPEWPRNCCRMACDALLADEKFRRKVPGVEMRWGTVPGHYWLELPDGSILDPTADQFFEEEGPQTFPAGHEFYAEAHFSIEREVSPNVVASVRATYPSLPEHERAAVERRLLAGLDAVRDHVVPERRSETPRFCTSRLEVGIFRHRCDLRPGHSGAHRVGARSWEREQPCE
jgi:hypothetical protein